MINVFAIVQRIISVTIDNLNRLLLDVQTFLEMGDGWWEQRQLPQPENAETQEDQDWEIEDQEEVDEGLQLVRLNNVHDMQAEYGELLEDGIYEGMGFLRRIMEKHGLSPFASIIRLLSQRRHRNRGGNQSGELREDAHANDTDSDEDSGNDFIKDISWLENENDHELYEKMLSAINSEGDISIIKKFYRFFLHEKLTQMNKPYIFQPLKLIRVPYKYWCVPGDFPSARSGHRVVATDSNLYSLGGYNPNRAPLRRTACKLYQELWSYNFATKRWALVMHPDNCNMPLEQASNALTVYNNVLIVSI